MKLCNNFVKNIMWIKTQNLGLKGGLKVEYKYKTSLTNTTFAIHFY